MSRKRTVLIVDDDREIVELMRDFLEDEQFIVVEAYNAIEALEALNRNRIDCILLDVMMPGRNGFELCRQIRRELDTPILFLSARGEDMDKIRGLSLGGTITLSNPPLLRRSSHALKPCFAVMEGMKGNKSLNWISVVWCLI